MASSSTTQDTATSAVGDDLLGQRLRHASTEALIQALIRLTHKVHDHPRDAIGDRLREQREYVIAEITRRAGTGTHGGAA